MIIILEGANGVGKSTYAEGIRRSLPECDLTPYRAFRGGDPDLHWGSRISNVKSLSLYEKLVERFKIPVNTYIDDLYLADFLRSFRCVELIMDRSLPSAIAYESLGEAAGETKAILEYWQELLGAQKDQVVYVWLTASHSVAKERTDGRWCPNKKEYTKIEKLFGKVFQRIRLPKMRIDTDVVDVESGVKSIVSRCKADGII